MFDRIDLAILRALQRDGSLSQSGLAEKVGASPASCWRRVKSLERADVLGQTIRLIEPDAVGLKVTALCHIRLKNHLPETSRSFERLVEDTPSVIECFAMSGDWDYLLQVIVPDIADYERLLRTRILTHPAVSSASSAFALSTLKRTHQLPI